jgi:hypothetical protein
VVYEGNDSIIINNFIINNNKRIFELANNGHKVYERGIKRVSPSLFREGYYKQENVADLNNKYL